MNAYCGWWVPHLVQCFVVSRYLISIAVRDVTDPGAATCEGVLLLDGLFMFDVDMLMDGLMYGESLVWC